MDLNSLEDELLAGILKYTKFRTRRSVRKLNSRLDNVARTFNLRTCVPVHELHMEHNIVDLPDISRIKLTAIYSLAHHAYFKRKNLITEESWRSDWLPMLIQGDNDVDAEKLLERLQVKKVHCKTTDSTVDNRFMDFLIARKREFRKMTFMKFYCPVSQFLVSRQKLIEFLATYKLLKSLLLIGNSVIHEIINSEVLGCRKWDSLYLTLSKEKEPPVMEQIDKSFLEQVIKNTKIFYCSNDSTVDAHLLLAFTVTELLDFIETCLLEDGCFSDQIWDFPLLALGDTVVAGLEERMTKNKAMNYCFTEHPGSESRLHRCKITIEPHVRISFSIERDNLTTN